MTEQPAGKLITLEGPSGVGKTTTTRLVCERLLPQGFPVHTTTEPSHGRLGEIARHNTDRFSGYALACLVAADRYHHLEIEVLPKIGAGFIVVSDRYVASSYVLQRMDGVPLPFVEAINSSASQPDLTVILQASPAVIAARVAARGAHNRFYTGKDTSKQEAELYEEAAALLSRRGHRMLALDTSESSPAEVADYLTARIVQLVAKSNGKPGSA